MKGSSGGGNGGCWLEVGVRHIIITIGIFNIHTLRAFVFLPRFQYNLPRILIASGEYPQSRKTEENV